MMNIYEASLKPIAPPLRRCLWASWTIFGLICLIALSWWGFGSETLFNRAVAWGLPTWAIAYIGIPLTMMFRGVLLVESIGYIYHRWFQHVSFWTRQAHLIRRNQRYHWIHHMIIYPIGTAYQKKVKYVKSEKGISWSWVVPALFFSGLFLLQHGVNLGGIVFVASVGVYAKFVVSTTHSRFHEIDHPWSKSGYFHWLEDIHLLHHWDQRCNFTIVHPFLDMLFGTYLAPKAYEEELKIAREDRELTVSDMINWRYLLLEATPAQYAAFISEAKRHQRSQECVKRLLKVLDERLERIPDDPAASLLKRRASDLLQEIAAV